MGNIQGYCCRDGLIEAEDQREEQSNIWIQNGNNCLQYGACNLPPTPPLPPSPPPKVYQIVLPKLILIDIESDADNKSADNHNDSNNSQQIDQSTTTTTTTTTATTATANTNISDNENVKNDDDQLPKETEEQLQEQLQEQQDKENEEVEKQQPAVIKEEYCAEKFQMLRSLMLKSPEEGEANFRKLLWSCVPWVAPGGKSGSTFLKTINDQFILKEMSKLELQSFLSIADEYFNYIESSYKDDKPSLLSTILGIYRIIYTNSATNSTSEYYFMVMRNLFYKRSISQRFDLKGSTRNRLVETNNPDDTDHVLMDENLRRSENPILIHARSKLILNQAINNDSKFLTSLSVMDYSLLVGVDKENQELVLGIIDYVRPFTWDKKIERVVKSVVGSELPTIIEPELYRERFCEAMNKYFESVPDNW